MSNGRAERMFRTFKRSLRKIYLAKPEEWNKFLPWIVYGYPSCRISSSKAILFEILYGVPTRMAFDPGFSCSGDNSEKHLELELLAIFNNRADRYLLRKLHNEAAESKFES